MCIYSLICWSKSDSKKFLCLLRLVWATLRFNQLEILICFSNSRTRFLAFTYEKYMCMFYLSPVSHSFFLFSSFSCLPHSLYLSVQTYIFIGKMCVYRFWWTRERALYTKNPTVYSIEIYLARIHLCTHCQRFESNNTMKMST